MPEQVKSFSELVNLDKVNVVQLQHLNISLQAIEDKIIVLVDQFKTGFECKECGGSGKLKSTVVEGAERNCDACGGKGALLVIPKTAESLPSTGYVVSVGPKTAYMVMQQIDKDLKNPNTSEDMKIELLYKKQGATDILIQPGSRIVFGPHVGTFLPMKGNVKFKVMREHDPLCIMFGDEMADKNFIDYETQNY